MRPGLAVMALVLAALASGCLDDGSRADRSVTCVDGVCEACVAGACAPCDPDECDACLNTPECPALARAASAPSGVTLADVSIQETHPLTQGLPQTTWTFAVAPGATGHVVLTLQDLASRSAAVNAEACLEWEIDGPGGQTGGSTGCNDAIGLSGTTQDQPRRLLSWQDLGPGDYRITLDCPQQPNELVVDIVVDNP